MSVQDNAAKVKSLIEQIEAHPTCLRFVEINGKYRVYHPAGFRYDASQVSYSDGKIVALERLLKSIEVTWVAGGLGLWTPSSHKTKGA